MHAGGSNRGRCRRLLAPFVDEENHNGGANQKIKNGHKPGDEAETGFRRLGVDCSAEFLNKGLSDFVFGITALHHDAEFLEHGGGHSAADVIALRENLAATAHALEFAADFFNAVALLLGEKRENGKKCDGEKRCYQPAALRMKRRGNI